ncbi:hypothetical protein ACJOV8_014320 [Formosa sp. 3Alg 14/1]|uniref:hypothetical protein n=1 Tax=Formosa sp. 3Alg 14/1 TaxID=3382190 RepID=UPI0039BE2B0D
MEDRNDLSKQIVLATTKIREECPELIKFMGEVPISFQSTDEKGVNNKELKDYLKTLNDLLESYEKEH